MKQRFVSKMAILLFTLITVFAALYDAPKLRAKGSAPPCTPMDCVLSDGKHHICCLQGSDLMKCTPCGAVK